MYIEGDIPTMVTNGNCTNGNGAFGNNGDWIWAILLLALLGRNGIGENGGGNGGFYPYPFAFGGSCGSSCATQADLAAGFNNSAVLSSLNDIKLGQQQAINYNNQGFSGLNATIIAGFSGVDKAICSLGYQQAQLVNGLSRELADCCCATQRAIDSVKYENAKNTCDIIRAGQDNTRAILDYLTGEKIATLTAENSGLKAQISNDRQSAYIIEALAPKCPQPAYVVQPAQPVTFPTNCCGNVAYANFGYGGCGTSVQ